MSDHFTTLRSKGLSILRAKHKQTLNTEFQFNISISQHEASSI